MKRIFLAATLPVCIVLAVGMFCVGRSARRNSLEERLLLLEAEKRTVKRFYKYGDSSRDLELSSLWSEIAGIKLDLNDRDGYKWATDQAKAKETAWKTAMDAQAAERRK